MIEADSSSQGMENKSAPTNLYTMLENTDEDRQDSEALQIDDQISDDALNVALQFLEFRKKNEIAMIERLHTERALAKTPDNKKQQNRQALDTGIISMLQDIRTNWSVLAAKNGKQITTSGEPTENNILWYSLMCFALSVKDLKLQVNIHGIDKPIPLTTLIYNTAGQEPSKLNLDYFRVLSTILSKETTVSLAQFDAIKKEVKRSLESGALANTGDFAYNPYIVEKHAMEVYNAQLNSLKVELAEIKGINPDGSRNLDAVTFPRQINFGSQLSFVCGACGSRVEMSKDFYTLRFLDAALKKQVAHDTSADFTSGAMQYAVSFRQHVCSHCHARNILSHETMLAILGCAHELIKNHGIVSQSLSLESDSGIVLSPVALKSSFEQVGALIMKRNGDDGIGTYFPYVIREESEPIEETSSQDSTDLFSESPERYKAELQKLLVPARANVNMHANYIAYLRWLIQMALRVSPLFTTEKGLLTNFLCFAQSDSEIVEEFETLRLLHTAEVLKERIDTETPLAGTTFYKDFYIEQDTLKALQEQLDDTSKKLQTHKITDKTQIETKLFQNLMRMTHTFTEDWSDWANSGSLVDYDEEALTAAIYKLNLDITACDWHALYEELLLEFASSNLINETIFFFGHKTVTSLEHKPANTLSRKQVHLGTKKYQLPFDTKMKELCDIGLQPIAFARGLLLFAKTLLDVESFRILTGIDPTTLDFDNIEFMPDSNPQALEILKSMPETFKTESKAWELLLQNLSSEEVIESFNRELLNAQNEIDFVNAEDPVIAAAIELTTYMPSLVKLLNLKIATTTLLQEFAQRQI